MNKDGGEEEEKQILSLFSYVIECFRLFDFFGRKLSMFWSLFFLSIFSLFMPLKAVVAKSWDDAVMKAQASSKPILICFTGKNKDGGFWCPPCRQLDDMLLSQDSFDEWQADRVVFLEIPVYYNSSLIPEDDMKLIEEHQIRGVPSLRYGSVDGEFRTLPPYELAGIVQEGRELV